VPPKEDHIFPPTQGLGNAHVLLPPARSRAVPPSSTRTSASPHGMRRVGPKLGHDVLCISFPDFDHFGPFGLQRYRLRRSGRCHGQAAEFRERACVRRPAYPPTHNPAGLGVETRIQHRRSRAKWRRKSSRRPTTRSLQELMQTSLKRSGPTAHSAQPSCSRTEGMDPISGRSPLGRQRSR
jgi:hypothetical protein